MSNGARPTGWPWDAVSNLRPSQSARSRATAVSAPSRCRGDGAVPRQLLRLHCGQHPQSCSVRYIGHLSAYGVTTARCDQSAQSARLSWRTRWLATWCVVQLFCNGSMRADDLKWQQAGGRRTARRIVSGRHGLWCGPGRRGLPMRDGSSGRPCGDVLCESVRRCQLSYGQWGFRRLRMNVMGPPGTLRRNLRVERPAVEYGRPARRVRFVEQSTGLVRPSGHGQVDPGCSLVLSASGAPSSPRDQHFGRCVLGQSSRRPMGNGHLLGPPPLASSQSHESIGISTTVAGELVESSGLASDRTWRRSTAWTQFPKPRF